MFSDDSPLSHVDELGRPHVRVFTDADGIPQNSVQALTRDSRGYLWVGTQDGAAYYNGRSWTVVRIPGRSRSNNIRALLARSDGSIWFGTIGGGLARLQDNSWTFYDSTGLFAHDDIRCLFESRLAPSPTIWVGTTRGGVARFDGRAWSVFDEHSGFPGDGVTSFAETRAHDGGHLLWAGTFSGGLACFDGRTWTRYSPPPQLSRLGNVLSLQVGTDDGARVLWVGLPSGLCSFDLEREEFRALPGVDTPVFCLLKTVGARGEIIWAGTGGAKLHRLEMGALTTYGSTSGLPEGRIFDLLPASDPARYGTLWVGTDAGLALVDEHAWWTLDEKSGLPNRVAWNFANVRGDNERPSICIGTDGGGVALLERGGWQVHNVASGLPSDVAWRLLDTAIDDESSVLFVGTERGLCMRRAGEWETLDRAAGLPHLVVRALATSILPDGSRALWLATPDGIFRLARGSLESFVSSSGLPVQDVWSLLETGEAGERTLWAASRGGGLAVFANGRWDRLDTSSGLPNNLVTCLHESRSRSGEATLWVGTAGGVAYRSLTNPAPQWSVLDDSTVPALPNNTVYHICEDSDGRLYVSTNKGITRLTPRAPTPADPAEFSVFTFTKEDGLPSNECNSEASLVDSQGRIWVGTVEGVAYYDPSREVADTTPKPLHIERVRLNGAEVDFADFPTFSYDENNLEFEFTLVSFRHEGDTRYRTQLVGFDRDPADWSPDFRRNYTNLPRGDFEFRVWARDGFDIVSGPVSAAFRIRPAPWRTWWAYLGYVGAIAGAGYVGVRYRIRSLQQRSDELQSLVDARTVELANTVGRLRESEQQARDANRAKSVFLSNMSHELRTPLNAVIGLAELLGRDDSVSVEHQETLAIIHRSGEHLLGLINDVLSLSKIEAGKVTLNAQPYNLPLLLRSVAEMTNLRAEAKGLEVVFERNSPLPETVLGDEGKLRQVLINLLGNAIKFTESGRIVLRVEWVEGIERLSVEVQDTGSGIAAPELDKLFRSFEQTESGRQAQEGTGLGLVISREIVKLMGGDIWVRSVPGVGTTFGFQVDLPIAESVAPDARRRVIGLADREPETRLLVADDTAENRLVLTRLLESVGFVVREAVDGHEAVRIWRDWRPHLIWMDVRMHGLDGIEATRAIRAAEGATNAPRGRTVSLGSSPDHVESVDSDRARISSAGRCKIIALTASVFEHERQSMLDVGADDLVLKPFVESTVFAKLEEHLGVRFTFEDVGPSGGESGLLVASQLASIPREHLAAVYNALWLGDSDNALKAVEEILPYSEAVAADIARRIRSFQFREILDALKPYS